MQVPGKMEKFFNAQSSVRLKSGPGRTKVGESLAEFGASLMCLCSGFQVIALFLFKSLSKDKGTLLKDKVPLSKGRKPLSFLPFLLLKDKLIWLKDKVTLTTDNVPLAKARAFSPVLI